MSDLLPQNWQSINSEYNSIYNHRSIDIDGIWSKTNSSEYLVLYCNKRRSNNCKYVIEYYKNPNLKTSYFRKIKSFVFNSVSPKIPVIGKNGEIIDEFSNPNTAIEYSYKLMEEF